MSMTENKKLLFPGVKDGETIEIAGIEFIKFPGKDGNTPVVAKDILFDSRFGEENDFRKSIILKKLEDEYLPLMIEAIGEENLCKIKTDLATLDGLKQYGVMESFVSLPTLDFYRENAEIFGKYTQDDWWWLATPESAQPNSEPDWVLCVSPAGCVGSGRCNGSGSGVRPFYILKSSIFESSEDQE